MGNLSGNGFTKVALITEYSHALQDALVLQSLGALPRSIWVRCPRCYPRRDTCAARSPSTRARTFVT